MKKVFSLVLVAVCSICAHAYLEYNFTSITNASLISSQIGQEQFVLQIEEYGTGQILFTFRNLGPNAGSIADIYFQDDSGLIGSAEIFEESSGVDFSEAARPANLPAGKPLGFDADEGFSFGSEPSVSHNGINSDEYLIIVVTPEENISFNEIKDALDRAAYDIDEQMPRLDIGMHAIAFPCGNSESFILTPEPTTLLLLAVGLTGILLQRKK